jgi:hypothetical protein
MRKRVEIFTPRSGIQQKYNRGLHPQNETQEQEQQGLG